MTGRQKVGDYYYMFDAATGQAISGWQTYITTDGTAFRMYFDPDTYQAVTGVYTIDGEMYNFTSTTGYMKTTSTTVDGTKYYFDNATGAAYTGTAASNGNTWETVDGNTYYYDIYGEPVTGLRVIENVLYYFDAKGVMQTGLVEADNGKTYYFDESGAAQTGMQTIGGKTYYFSTADGTMVTGFCNVDGTAYYSTKTVYRKPAGWNSIPVSKVILVRTGESLPGCLKLTEKSIISSPMVRWQPGYNPSQTIPEIR